jgi:hypothetical protein
VLPANISTTTDLGPGIERIGQIHVDFTRVDHSKMRHRREGMFRKKVWNLQFSVVVEFGSQTGILEFKTVYNGNVFGTAAISFD